MIQMVRALIVLPILSVCIPSALAEDGGNGFGTLVVSGFGFGHKNFADIVDSLMRTFQASMFFVATCAFIAGAFFTTISGVKEEYKALGKDLMIGAVIGAAVVWGARQILLTVLFFIYGSY